tara:strand:+ start:427 stop:606 length:180 start_codon:yes stop_codon:yes gene_type:complete
MKKSGAPISYLHTDLRLYDHETFAIPSTKWGVNLILKIADKVYKNPRNYMVTFRDIFKK